LRTVPIDTAVARLAAAQHGLVTVAQLLELGFSQAAIRRRVATGRWVKVDRGVIRIAGAPVTWESQVLACVLAAGEGAVASHRTAAALWQLDGSRRGTPDISVPRNRRYQRDVVYVHRATDLDRIRPVRRSGIPTTPIERTLLDLGAVSRRGLVELAIDHARRRGLTDWDHLLTCLVSHARRGRDGVGTLRAILDDHSAEVRATDSGFERLVYVRLVEAGLPRPVLQYEVHVDGRTYRLDLAYPDLKLAIELDGSIHLRRDVWEKDHARQNALMLDGWTILRFTWRDYTEHQTRLVSEVRAALVRLAQ
jgi:very-short-patch-repair endonuclease